MTPYRPWHQKFYLRCAIGVCLLALVAGAIDFYNNLEAGFRLHKIQSDLTYNPDWDTGPESPEELAALQSLLEQKFTYIGKGAQCYAFLSDDGKHVLKLFKHHHMRVPGWIQMLPLGEYKEKKARRKRAHLENTFNSYLLSYRELKEETGLEYIHLNKSKHLQREVTIVLPSGAEQVLNIDDYEFMIQAKAELILPLISEHLAAGRRKEAERGVDAFYELVVRLARKGAVDKDAAFAQNYGLLRDHPINIDVGQFGLSERHKSGEGFREAVMEATRRLSAWFKTREPEIAPYVELRGQEILETEA